MKIFILAASFLFSVAHADSACPTLNGSFECKTKDTTNVYLFKQETVDGIEKYEVPLLEEQGTVIANGKKYGDEKHNVVAICAKKKLAIEETKYLKGSDVEILYFGKYNYSVNKKGQLEAAFEQDITINGKTKSDSFKLRCNPVK